MFEDVFEPFDEIVDEDLIEKRDEWDTGDTWDTGEKEDVWRADHVVGGVWSVDPPLKKSEKPQNVPIPTPIPTPDSPLPENDQNDGCESDDCGVCERSEECDKSSGLFDDLFLEIL